MPPICWCLPMLGWVGIIALVLVPLIWLGLTIEEIRARRRGDR